jgi:hypothetical protein
MPRKLIQVDHIILAKTWRLFDHYEKRMSAHDLADALQIAILTSWKWCRALHAQGLIHICDWRQDTLGRYQTPVFAAGDKLDKPKLRKTNLDRRLEYKRRKELRSKQEQRQGQASDVYRLLFGDV